MGSPWMCFFEQVESRCGHVLIMLFGHRVRFGFWVCVGPIYVFSIGPIPVPPHGTLPAHVDIAPTVTHLKFHFVSSIPFVSHRFRPSSSNQAPFVSSVYRLRLIRSKPVPKVLYSSNRSVSMPYVELHGNCLHK